MAYDITYPTSWAQVSRADLRHIATVVYLGCSRNATLVLLFCALAHLTPLNAAAVNDSDALRSEYWFRDRKGTVVAVPASVVSQACKDLSYIVDEVGLPAECPIEGVSVKIYGVTFEAYFQCDAYLAKYASDGKRSTLSAAWHCLTDRRMGADWRIRAVELRIWWAGLNAYLRERYPYVYSKDSDGATNPAETLQTILTCLSGGRPQDCDAIMKSDANSVLDALNMKVKMQKDNADTGLHS